MSWNEIRDAHRRGTEIGSHTVNHPNLYHSDDAVLETEVRESKAQIEDQLGEAIHSFAYPYAFPENDKEFRLRFTTLLHDAGYQSGVTTSISRASANDNRYRLPRLPINLHDDLPFFAAKLEGHYDWLRKPQYLHKALKARFRNSLVKSVRVSPSTSQV